MKRLKDFMPLLILIALGLLLWKLGFLKYLSIDSLRLHEHELMALVHDHFFLALGLYIGTYILVVALSMPAAAPMTIAGGFLFGQWIGTGNVIVAATFGATIFFLSARRATQSTAQNAGPWITKMQSGFQENAWSYLLTLRLIPIFPFVAVNLVAALVQIPLRTFFWGTFFGIIPGTFVYVSLGVALKDAVNQPITPALIVQPSILLALGGLGVLALLPLLYKRLRKP